MEIGAVSAQSRVGDDNRFEQAEYRLSKATTYKGSNVGPKDKYDHLVNLLDKADVDKKKKTDPRDKAHVTHWPAGSKAGGAGGRKKSDGIALDFGSGGGDSWGGADYSASAGVGASSSTQESLRQAVHAAGQASSAPSSQAQIGSSAGAGSMTVHVDQIDIAVSGAGNARETAEEVWRMLTQRAGRLTRSPGVGRF